MAGTNAKEISRIIGYKIIPSWLNNEKPPIKYFDKLEYLEFTMKERYADAISTSNTHFQTQLGFLQL